MSRVFFSYSHKVDSWRVATIRNMGVIEGNKALSDNDWQQVRRGGDAAIKQWIQRQMSRRSCTIVLIGEDTAFRPWVNFEIREAWRKRHMGLFGIRIHNLLDRDGSYGTEGPNPFKYIRLTGGETFADLFDVHDPLGWDSKDVYADIEENLTSWVEWAIRQRKQIEAQKKIFWGLFHPGSLIPGHAPKKSEDIWDY